MISRWKSRRSPSSSNRKSSPPRPSSSSSSGGGLPGFGGGGGGGGAGFRRKLFSRKKSDTDPSTTLLPTTYRPSDSSSAGFATSVGKRRHHHHRHRQAGGDPTQIGCTSFLLGGTYYPGKDKRRRHLRRRTWWHRIFCSSPGRVAASSILAGYVALWWIVVPVGEGLLAWGRALSGGERGGGAGTGGTSAAAGTERLGVPPIPDRLAEALHSLNEGRSDLSADLSARLSKVRSEERRVSILGEIVPDWFRRNDGGGRPVRDGAEEEHRGGGDDGGGGRGASDGRGGRGRGRKEERRQSEGDGGGVRAVEGDGPRPPRAIDEAGVAGRGRGGGGGPDAERRTAAAAAKAAKAKAAVDAAGDVPGESDRDRGRAGGPDPAANTGGGGDDRERRDRPLVEPEKKKPSPPARPRQEKAAAALVVDPRDRAPRTLRDSDASVHPVTSSCPRILHPNDVSTTLVVQTSVDRMWMVEETCRRWTDPIIAVLYLPHGDDRDDGDVDWENDCPQLTIIEYRGEPNGAIPKWDYPVNSLRNVGLDAVSTSHVLVMDVDFVPSLDLADVVRRTLREQMTRTASDERKADGTKRERALIVPAFDRTIDRPCRTMDECRNLVRTNEEFVPRTFEELVGCVKDDKCITFQSDVNFDGHSTTRTDRWLARDWYDDGTIGDPSMIDDGRRTTPRKIREVKCFDSLRYEPYVVLRWCPPSSVDDAPDGNAAQHPVLASAPYYDERFHGYGKNKIQHVTHLRFLGYRFDVLPRGFVVHRPHPISVAKEAWNDVDAHDLHRDMDRLYPQFVKELVEKYKEGEDAVPQCGDENGRKRKRHGVRAAGGKRKVKRQGKR